LKDPGFAKFVLFVNSLIPLALLVLNAEQGHLGANPVVAALHTAGVVALVFLLLCLSITPLRKITGWNWLSHFRRQLGLWAFFYACVHLFIYVYYQQGLSLSGILHDTIGKKFIFLGMAAWLMMVPLTATSTTAAIKRLGAARWKQLHWLIYPTAICGVIHYYMSQKADVHIPKDFMAVLIVLLGYRIYKAALPPRRPAPRRVPAIEKHEPS
jgi:sulfoxide reductase heme-binding subunit YedZ